MTRLYAIEHDCNAEDRRTSEMEREALMAEGIEEELADAGLDAFDDFIVQEAVNNASLEWLQEAKRRVAEAIYSKSPLSAPLATRKHLYEEAGRHLVELVEQHAEQELKRIAGDKASERMRRIETCPICRRGGSCEV